MVLYDWLDSQSHCQEGKEVEVECTFCLIVLVQPDVTPCIKEQ